MDEITLTTILYKYKDQQPKQFGEDFGEKCYPVSAILNICEEYHQMMKEREQKEAEQQGNCNLPHVSNNEVAVCDHKIIKKGFHKGRCACGLFKEKQ